MGNLIDGNDGLPADDVGIWAAEKHSYLCRYIDISQNARVKYISGAGTPYIDLFCGSGRAQIRETGKWIDGGCIAAWKKSREGCAPFSIIYIADSDADKLDAAYQRLKALDAPVEKLTGNALEASSVLAKILNPGALHFAFLDPFNLASLDFRILKNLSKFKRMDMLIHYSQMDMQRNMGVNLSEEESAFDSFAPGWRNNIDARQNQAALRQAVFQYWKKLISSLGKEVSDDGKLIKGGTNQHLYWLFLIANHALAKKFWGIAANVEKQSSFSF